MQGPAAPHATGRAAVESHHPQGGSHHPQVDAHHPQAEDALLILGAGVCGASGF